MKSPTITHVFDRTAPRPGTLVGYGLLIQQYNLRVPPPARVSLIVPMRGRTEVDGWLLFGTSYAPRRGTYHQIVFSLKYEGVELHILKALFAKCGSARVAAWIRREPAGRSARRIWFLYEWLTGMRLPLEDHPSRDYVDLLDADLQYPGPVRFSRRHGIRNNLPGHVDFCPLVRRTPRLDAFIAMHLQESAKRVLRTARKDVISRASAYLMLEDSQASYAIEGERPGVTRARRWADVLAQAGRLPLTHDEIVRLQHELFDKPGFPLGYRTIEGFVGSRSPRTLEPIPRHISARHGDVPQLMEGLLEAHALLAASDMHPVVSAALLSFGFVFIHPFIDGNGRVHRYLLHHVLSETGFTPRGLLFPVSMVMLDRMDEYTRVLEAHALPRLACIDWETSPEHNVAIRNETIDLYRYFDATACAEFLFDCVRETIETTLPREIMYLNNHDRMDAWLRTRITWPDNMRSLLISFLHQGAGTLSQRARRKEFASLSQEQVDAIEQQWRRIVSASGEHA